MSKIKLFTHTDLDGIGCAVLAYLAFGRDNVEVEYCNYDDINKKVEAFGESEEYKSYDMVYITDISISESLAARMDMALAGNKVILLDHHATALGLNKYEWCDVRVEDRLGVKTSGTMLFWLYLDLNGYLCKFNYKTQDKIKEFARLVRDYDTWRWKELGLDHCKAVNDLFFMYGRDKFIDWVLERVYSDLKVFLLFSLTDMALLEQKQKDIDIYIESKDKQLVTIEDNFGYKCGVVFADRYVSELDNRLSELHPELDYISMIDVSKGTVSYRTVRDDIDLGNEIAHSFGGGGHRKAAGSTFDVNRIRGIVMKELFLI